MTTRHVWLVVEYDYEATEVHGVFRYKKAADNAAQAWRERSLNPNPADVGVESWSVSQKKR